MASRRSTTAALAVFALAGGCTPDAGPIVIGLAGPFSEARGESMRLAAELARDEINGAGGIGGRKIELRIVDDSANADAAVRGASALVADREVVAVVGHLTSGATLAAAPVYDRGDDPVVAITPSASSPEVALAGEWIFRLCPTDLLHGTKLGEFAARELGARRAAVLYHNDEYGRGVRSTFEERFVAAGGTVVGSDPYLPGTPNVRPYLERLVRRGAQAILVAGHRTEAERIIATLDSMGISLPILGADGLTGITAPAGYTAPIYVTNVYERDGRGARNQAFRAAYRTAHGERVPDHRGAGAYDAVHLIAKGIESVGADRAALRDWLAGVGGATAAYEGVLGRVAFDENGDVRDGNVVVYQANAAAREGLRTTTSAALAR
jgi:branched-chain amino acid transport system substrate-binding protein